MTSTLPCCCVGAISANPEVNGTRLTRGLFSPKSSAGVSNLLLLSAALASPISLFILRYLGSSSDLSVATRSSSNRRSSNRVSQQSAPSPPVAPLLAMRGPWISLNPSCCGLGSLSWRSPLASPLSLSRDLSLTHQSRSPLCSDFFRRLLVWKNTTGRIRPSRARLKEEEKACLTWKLKAAAAAAKHKLKGSWLVGPAVEEKIGWAPVPLFWRPNPPWVSKAIFWISNGFNDLGSSIGSNYETLSY